VHDGNRAAPVMVGKKRGGLRPLAVIAAGEVEHRGAGAPRPSGWVPGCRRNVPVSP